MGAGMRWSRACRRACGWCAWTGGGCRGQRDGRVGKVCISTWVQDSGGPWHTRCHGRCAGTGGSCREQGRGPSSLGPPLHRLTVSGPVTSPLRGLLHPTRPLSSVFPLRFTGTLLPLPSCSPCHFYFFSAVAKEAGLLDRCVADADAARDVGCRRNEPDTVAGRQD